MPAAYAAMCSKFVGHWPTLRGADGGEWDLRAELSFGAFCRVVRSMKPKAVGKSGMAAAMLQAKTSCARDFHMQRIAECDAKLSRIATRQALDEADAKAKAAPPAEEE